jgi:hypothetical protein
MKKSAILSECRTYRYELWQIWDESKPYAMFIGLNPSTADETDDDPIGNKNNETLVRLAQSGRFVRRSGIQQTIARRTDIYVSTSSSPASNTFDSIYLKM